MALKNPRKVTVVDKRRITPNMLRLVLGGEALADFPAESQSSYVKIVLPAADSGSGGAEKPCLRSYSVRFFDPDALLLTLDFVDHGDTGPASSWARHALPGDEITIAGPGPCKLVAFDSDWFLIAGDMTALPAISVNLEKLPRDARGYAVIEVQDQGDIQAIDAPPGIDLQWLVNPHPDRPNTLLTDAVKAKAWLEGQPGAWVATEFSNALALRGFLRDQKHVLRSHLYVSSYWQMGVSDEVHKIAKQQQLSTA